jgi:RimJ/RimL family protein N-acetyltransferase
MFRLDGKNVFLVSFEEEHLSDDRYFRWLCDYDVVKSLNRLEYIMPIKYEDVVQYCNAVWASHKDVFLALYAKEKEEFIGTVKIGNINWYSRTADVGIMIGEKKYWGKGAGTDAVWCVCKYLFEVLGLRKLTGGAMAVNEAMIKIFQNLGFKIEGRMRDQDRYEGTYCDHVYLGCFHREFVLDFYKEKKV